MEARQIKNYTDAQKLVNSQENKYIKVGVFDIDGILRGKYMLRKKFLSALNQGFGFCDVVLGWDSKDQLYDNVQFTGWHSGYPDALLKIIPDSCRELPLENNVLFFLAEFDGAAKAICPRSTLHRVLNKADSMGLQFNVGFEYEFFVFNENAHSVREKNYQNLHPLSPDSFGYSVIRNSVENHFYHDILRFCERMDFPLEGLHEETGPGVLEAAISYDHAQRAADKAALFKTFIKVLAQHNNLIATFMARWSVEWPGLSGHIHISMHDLDGRPLFHNADNSHNMSSTMRNFIAGQQALMPELLALIAPTINSYRRLIPGYWAPTSSSWGIDNRTCALRVIPGDTQSQRVEYRIAAADANPYLVLSAALLSGLYGIEQKLEPTEGVVGDAYRQNLPDSLQLPQTLWDAAQRLKQSDVARQYLGDTFVEHFAATREWEEREFRKHISDWELQRYFEII